MGTCRWTASGAAPIPDNPSPEIGELVVAGEWHIGPVDQDPINPSFGLASTLTDAQACCGCFSRFNPVEASSRPDQSTTRTADFAAPLMSTWLTPSTWLLSFWPTMSFAYTHTPYPSGQCIRGHGQHHDRRIGGVIDFPIAVGGEGRLMGRSHWRRPH